MAELAKAFIVEISGDAQPKEQGPRFPVQFNPTTLKLQIAASAAQGTPSGSQVRQSTGAPTTTLTLELVFDTSDEGSTEQPRSVREKTLQVEKFVFPKGQTGDAEKPPRIRFQWGSFVINGVTESIGVDIDHFAADGTPLRAKVSLAIKEQDSKLIHMAAGPGAGQRGNAPTPLGTPTGPPVGPSPQIGTSLGGESLPDFAARMGLDPAAWRELSVGAGLSLGVSLEAGVEIGFSAGLSASAGIGVTLGVEAGARASPEVAAGLAGDAGAGVRLSASGGVAAALQTVQANRAQAAAGAARAAFAAPAPTTPVSAAPRNAAPGSAAPRNAAPGNAAPGNATPASAASPRPDPRASGFGFGVPLRAMVPVPPAPPHRASSRGAAKPTCCCIRCQ
jgi:hypothetical protein